MTIQFFNPPVAYYQGVGYKLNPPLSLPLLTATCRNAGYDAEATDLEALGYNIERFTQVWRAARDAWPDVVGITCLSAQARGAKELVEAIRSCGYSGKIVVGGVHATIEPEDVLAWSGVDLVVTGECEGNVVDLMRNASGIVRGVPPDIHDVSIPAWKYMRPVPSDYLGNSPHLDMPEGITMWTRGCPYECVFCGNAIFSPTRKRWRRPDLIREELLTLRPYGIRSLFVYDDELVGVKAPEGWYSALADHIGDLGYTFKTQGRCSSNWVTSDVLSAMYRAGCRIIMWGVESFSRKVLASLGKGTTVEDNWHTLRLAREHGIKNFVFTMIGNAEEGHDELQDTATALGDAYREGLIQYRQTTVVTAVPHTKLWERQKHEGWYHAPPERGPQMAQVYHDTPWLKGHEIVEWLRRFAEACPVGYEG